MRVRCLLIGLVILLAVGISSSGHAMIDPETIVGIWLFDEGEGDITEDSSGNGHDGEFVGQIEWGEGKFGSALEFGATTNDFVRVPHHDDLTLETYTLAAWVKIPAVTGKFQTVVDKWWTDSFYGMWVRPDSGVVHHAHMEPGHTNQIVESKTAVADGEWHHIAGTYDQKVGRVYVDGVLEGEVPSTDKVGVSSGDVTIGKDSRPGPRLIGAIDEVAIFKVALSGDDVKDIVNNGLERATGITAVFYTGKITTTWAGIKAQD